MKKLIQIQHELKAPKGQFNSFGKYKYRSQEDILEALKPLLSKYECTLTISDEIREILGIPFVEAKATIYDGEESITVRAHAGIDINKKGMDIAQTFGSSSSYARKYALHGLFLIDDNKDSDDQEPELKSDTEKPKQNVNAIPSELLNEVSRAIERTGNLQELLGLHKKYEKEIQKYPSIKAMFTGRKNLLNGDQ